MTIIAFDGKHLVADGASTVSEEREKPYYDAYHKTKIVVPEFEWFDPRSKTTIMALAGTGSVEDIDDVIQELLYYGRSKVDMGDHINRLTALLDKRADCQVVYVGTAENKDGEIVPTSGNLFNAGDYRSRTFRFKGGYPALAGVSSILPNWKLKEGWNNALEIVSFTSLFSPDTVGGLITRFNIRTGKIDHPKRTGDNRLSAMVKKYEQEETARLKEIFDVAKKLIKTPINNY